MKSRPEIKFPFTSKPYATNSGLQLPLLIVVDPPEIIIFSKFPGITSIVLKVDFEVVDSVAVRFEKPASFPDIIPIVLFIAAMLPFDIDHT